jgi:membrane-associated phospholipid phosphatase
MTGANHRPLLAWPGWRHIGFASLLTVIVTAWFTLVFVATNHFTAIRAARVRVHLDAELHIPLMPAFIIFYMSIYLLFAAAPLVLRTRREITRLAVVQSLAILIAGIFFLLIPAELAYPPPTHLGVWQSLLRFADDLNLDYNLVPSLHVALSFVCIELFSHHTNRIGSVLLWVWGVLIAASTILTHQHHLLDAVTGWLLAMGTLRLVRRIEKLSPSSELSTPPTSYSA